MRPILKYFVLLFVCCYGVFTAHAQGWVNIGSAGFSADSVWYTSIAIDRFGRPYVAYQDFSDSLKATVMRYDGRTWVTEGNVGFTEGKLIIPL